MSDPWRVKLTAQALRGLDALSGQVAWPAEVFIAQRLPVTRIGKPLSGELKGYHSARMGAFRVIYRIDEGQHVIWVNDVVHRGHAYRRR